MKFLPFALAASLAFASPCAAGASRFDQDVNAGANALLFRIACSPTSREAALADRLFDTLVDLHGDRFREAAYKEAQKKYKSFSSLDGYVTDNMASYCAFVREVFNGKARK